MKNKIGIVLGLILVFVMSFTIVSAYPSTFSYAHDWNPILAIAAGSSNPWEYSISDFIEHPTGDNDFIHPIELRLSSSDSYYIAAQNDELILWGFNEAGLFVKIVEHEIETQYGSPIILRVFGVDVSGQTQQEVGLVMLYADHDIVQVSRFSVSPSSYTKTYDYAIYLDTDSIPETSVDCNFYDGSLRRHVCAYGSTTGKVVTFGTEAGKNNILEIGAGINFRQDNEYQIAGIPNTVLVSQGEYEIIVVNMSTVPRTLSGTGLPTPTQIIWVDMRECNSEKPCVVPSEKLSIVTDSYSLPVGSGSDSHKSNLISGITKFPVSFYNPSLPVDSPKMICYSNKESAGYWDSEGKIKDTLKCYREGNLIFSVVLADADSSTYDAAGPTSVRPIGSTYPLPVLDYNKDGKVEICSDGAMYAAAGGTISVYNALNCVDLRTQTKTVSSSFAAATGDDGEFIVGAGEIYLTDPDLGPPYKDTALIYWSKQSNELQGRGFGATTLYTLPNIAELSTGYVHVSDMGNTDNQVLIQVHEGYATVHYAYEAPTPDFYKDENDDYQCVFGFYDPMQNGTNQTFNVKQCQYIDSPSCSYFLDGAEFFDREYVCMLDGDDVEVCGDPDYTNPTVSVFFDNVGTYDRTLYLFQEFTGNLLGEFEFSFVVNTNNNSIINLVPVCNQPNFDYDPDEPDPDDPDQPDGDGSYINSVMGALERNAKGIIGLILVVAMVASLASYGVRNPIVLMMTGIIALVIVSMLGLISTAVLVYVLLSIVILIVLSITVFKTNND